MTSNRAFRKIGIIGAGKIGQPAGRHWTAAGHIVTFGSRTPERLAAFTASLGDRARAGTLMEAADAAEVVLLSVPYPALDTTVRHLAGKLAGKIVIDAANPMGLSDDGRIISTLPTGVTEGRRIAGLLPDSAVVRGFTHVMDELLWSRGTQQRHFWGMAMAGDDPGAKKVAAELVEDAGFVPVDLGGLDDSAPLDPGGAIFPHIFTPADLRHAAGLDG